MLSMLDGLALASSRRSVTVVHADRSPADHAHRAEQGELVMRLPNATLHLWYETPDAGASDDCGVHPVHEGRADLAGLALPAGTTPYLCGPLPFMRAVRGQLLDMGLEPAAVHYEVFGPDLWRPA